MRTIRRLLTIAVVGVAVLVAPISGVVVAQDAQRIAAVVNDDIISIHDLASRVKLLVATSNLPDTPASRRRVAPIVLRQLINEKLKLQEAKRLDVRVSRSETNKALARVANQIGLSPQDLARFLASRGVGMAPLIDQTEAEIAWVKTVSRRMKGQIRISEEEVDARIHRIEANAGKPEFRVAEIFLPVDDPGKQAEVESLGNRLMQELREGASFPSLARNFSQGVTAAKGGELGWIRSEQLGPELQATIEDMAPGEVVGPVRAVDGYHIVLVIDRRVAPRIDRGRVLVSLQQLVLPLTAAPSESDIREQKQRAQELTADVGSCEDLDKVAKEQGSSSSGYLGTVELDQLDAPLQGVVRPLRTGDVSAPFQSGDGIIVVMVCERSEEATSAELRQRVENLLMNERLAAAARRLIRDLRREAFVDIRI